MDALSKRLDQSPVFGEDTDVIYFALLRFENPVRLYSTFFAVFTAECGLAVISFLSVSLVERITGEFWIDSTAWDFYSLYRLLRKFKRELSFLFVGKWTSFSLWNYEIVPPHPLPALLLAPFFALSLTPVPLSLLLNSTETLATQANGHLNLKVEVLPH